MNREKQIEEIKALKLLLDDARVDMVRFNSHGEALDVITVPAVDSGVTNQLANILYNAGYRKQSEVIRCKDCKYFREYSTEYLREVEKADGDCYIRRMNSDNEQFVACCRDDFCSFAKMKGGAE